MSFPIPNTDPLPHVPRSLLVTTIVLLLLLQIFFGFGWLVGAIRNPTPPPFMSMLAGCSFPTLGLISALAMYARKNGRDGKWGFMGLLSFIRVIIVLSLPPRNNSLANQAPRPV